MLDIAVPHTQQVVSRAPADALVRWSQVAGVGTLIAVMSFIYSIAMFRGVECHSGYFGNVYQVLHPGSFPTDPYMSSTRPTLLSLYYVLVRMVGNLWLDDRLTILLFMGIAAISLIGLDKTVQLLGAHRVSERVALLSFMLLEHRFFDNHALLIDNYEFNPTTLAAPCAIWLFYFGLAGGRPLVVIPVMVLLSLVSIKSAWLPILVTVVLLWKEQLRFRGKMIAGLVVLVVGMAGALYFLHVRSHNNTDAALFDYILQLDGKEANPFFNPLVSNLFFVGLCLAGFFIQGPPPSVLARVRMVARIGLMVWLVGGWYLSFAPNAIKIPYLVPFDVTRALWWPQYVLYVAIGVVLLQWFQRTKSWMGLGVSWLSFLGLYLVHIEMRTKVAAVFLLVTAMLWWRMQWVSALSGAHGALAQPRWLSPRRLNASSRVRIVAFATALASLSLYGVGTVHRRMATLYHLVRYGIVGDNPGAKWIGVNAYLRAHTPIAATILALSTRRVAGKEVGLQYDGSLRIRAGRSMPLGHPVALYFDYQKLQQDAVRSREMDRFIQAWEQQDLPGVRAHLAALGSPDYLVIPTANAAWLRKPPRFAYRIEATIKEFTIFQKRLQESKVEPANNA